MTNKSLALLMLGAAACSPAPAPSGQLDEPILSCDQQVDNAVAALNAANATANGVEPKLTGLSGRVFGFGFGFPADVAAVDRLVKQFYDNDSVSYTPAAGVAPNGSTIPFPIFQPAGISISATYQNKLTLARSYGYADPTAGNYAEPDSRFRLASISKSITGMGIMKLVHDGNITLDYQPFNDPGFVSHLGGYWETGAYTKCKQVDPTTYYVPDGCGGMNPKLYEITVRDLLHHAGGWDRTIPGFTDPMQLAWTSVISKVPGTSTPPTCADTIRFFLDQPLQHEPGTESVYSNLGFCVLGEVIAYQSSMAYSDYIHQNVLAKLHMTETALGHTAQNQPLDREVSYFDPDPNVPLEPSVFNGGLAPRPYGGKGNVYLEGADAASGWVSSAIDLAHFGWRIEQQKLPNFPATMTDPNWPGEFSTLTEEEESYDSLALNCLPIIGCLSVPATSWYGAGWDSITPVGSGPSPPTIWTKGGGMDGTQTWIEIHGEDDWTVTVLMNGSPPDYCANDPKCVVPESTQQLADNVWYYIHDQKGDYFPQYGDAVYSDWQSQADFDNAVSTGNGGLNQSPSRLDGRQVVVSTRYPPCGPEQAKNDECPPPIITYAPQYRARWGAAPASGAPNVVTNLDCTAMKSQIQSGTNGQLVSLQKFFDNGAGVWRYQAVFSAP